MNYQNENKRIYVIGIIAAIAVVCFGLVFTGVSLAKKYGVKQTVTSENAKQVLEDMLGKVDSQEVSARKANVELGGTTLSDELPDIEKYPLSVQANTSSSIEIFSSPEKAGTGNDGWLNEVAQAFNNQKFVIDGKEVSVSIRSIASGMGMDYIVSGKYRPDAFTPSNELWGQMIESNGVPIKLETNRLVGNVAGILLTESKNNEMKSKYGEISMKTITEATSNNEIAMGYTNPYVSSTGLNFLLSTLSAFDASNPLSNQAIEGFEKFQKNVPFVAYTTLQMREAAESGVLDGFIMEQQTYANTPELRKYVFTPFGVRHDNPMYSIGALSEEKQAILDKFIEFSMTAENQQLATKYGFNGLDSYASETTSIDGNDLISAQHLWKEKKDSGKPVTAVFVADTSGSMDGEPLAGLKESLLNGAQYINADNYIGLVSYNTNVYVNLPIAKFDLNQRAYFTGAVEDLSSGGGTASFDALLVALDMLLKAKEANPDTKLMMFLLSDGETNQGYDLSEVKDVLKALQIPVYTIGYNANLDALKEISNINEAANISADSDDVIYKLKSLFNAQM